jgi:hypothetical protein
MSAWAFERLAAQPPARWDPNGQGFAGKYTTRVGSFDGWVGVSERGVVAPPWSDAVGWRGFWYRLPLRWSNETAADFTADAERFLNARAPWTTEIVQLAPVEPNAQPHNGGGRMDSYEIKKVELNHADVMREMNAAMSGGDPMHEIARIVRQMSEDFLQIEREQATTISRMPERLAETFERARQFHFDASKGVRFFSLGLASQGAAERASDLAQRDMHRVREVIEAVADEQFTKLGQRAMQARMLLMQAVLPFLAAAPKSGNAVEAFQRLLLASRNGVAAGGE